MEIELTIRVNQDIDVAVDLYDVLSGIAELSPRDAANAMAFLLNNMDFDKKLDAEAKNSVLQWLDRQKNRLTENKDT